MAGDGQVDAISFAHPSVAEPSDFEKISVPSLFMVCEVDDQFTKAKREATQPVLECKAKEGVFVRFSYYPRVTHGWAIKGDENDVYDKKAMNHAAAEAIGFFSLELN